MMKIKLINIAAVYVLVLTCLAEGYAIAGYREPQQHKRDPLRIEKPSIQDPGSGKSYRLDWCYNRGNNCGQTAATQYCRTSIGGRDPYVRAIEFKMAADIGASTPTWIMGDQEICNLPSCDGFAYIICSD